MESAPPEAPTKGSTIPPGRLPAPAAAGAGGKVWQKVEWGAQGARTQGRDREQYGAFNAMLFVIFVAPTLLFAIFLGEQYMGVPYYFVIVWVHEAGHGFWCLLFGSGFVCSLMGFGSEMLFVLVPAVICMRERRLLFASCVLLMCVGLSMQHNGRYMQSALDPQGTSFAGALSHRYNDMSTDPDRLEMHDWSNIFRILGVVDYSLGMGLVFEQAGRAIAVSFMAGATIGLLPLLGDSRPRSFWAIASPGGLAAFAYFVLSGGLVECVMSLLLAAPLLHALAHRVGLRV
jgi:hypothetical protein